MREIIKRGPSAEKVIKEFKKGCRFDCSKLEYVVEYKGSRGLFSLFKKKDAIVKFKVPEPEDIIKDYLKQLLKYLDISYKNIDVQFSKTTYNVHIKGVDNPGILIGKDGKMLDSIQLLLNKLVDDKEKKSDNVILDVENYKARHSGSSPDKKRHQKKFSKNINNNKPPRKSSIKPRRPNLRKKT